MEPKNVIEVTEKIAKKAETVRKKTRGKFLSYISAALALVAGLAWNDAISTFIKYVFPLDSHTMIAKFIYAAILTVFISLVIVYLESVLGDKEEN
jgi:uncharacterized membrane protein YidH (DUF202 family)